MRRVPLLNKVLGEPTQISGHYLVAGGELPTGYCVGLVFASRHAHKPHASVLLDARAETVVYLSDAFSKYLQLTAVEKQGVIDGRDILHKQTITPPTDMHRAKRHHVIDRD